ncbi:uncharacterized protein LOC111266293 [Varroa jacobsoni]|uniref:uncharacterized protein LOC111266293 n=1 Tax=Varroa jacobsoni TaxID=62625 RepID=UPI000BF4F177|nr:uncharacterized protein LOC111266293 [Varroa jacobsoni]
MRTTWCVIIFLAALFQGTASYSDQDLQFSASSMNQPPYNQYQVLVLLLQDGHQQQQVAAAPGQSAGPEYSVPLTYPYPAAPKTRSPANNWHTLVFGNHQSTAPSAAYLHENILSGNSVNALFAPTGPALNEHEYPPVHPPRPSFPAHLSTIQNQHPHGDDYWKGLQGDRADCPTISSCPARYGCYIQQKPGTRCSYCKCKPRPSRSAGEHK